MSTISWVLVAIGVVLLWIFIGKLALPCAEILGAMAGDEEWEKEHKKDKHRKEKGNL